MIDLQFDSVIEREAIFGQIVFEFIFDFNSDFEKSNVLCTVRDFRSKKMVSMEQSGDKLSCK